MQPDLCLAAFEPRLLPKIWGARNLGRWGKKLPEGGAFGECWELFDDAEGSPLCIQGPARGRSLAELARSWGQGLYGQGRGAVQGRFPLLIKLLDAAENLSVQVHPDDALAQALHGPQARGKNEMWVVLEAAPGASVLNGFKPGTTWAALKAAVAGHAVVDLLHRVPVKAGDVIDVPAGRPHALGAGCLVLEVQSNSDWTYRLWDYGRLERGQARALHLREAERALRFDALGTGQGLVAPAAIPQPWGRREELVSNGDFLVERWTLDADASVEVQGRMRVLFPVRGGAEIRTAGDPAAWPMAHGACSLVPSALPCRVQAGPGGAQLICAEAR
ncbi:MAG TPA: type I phosphomannose isomerase catalytic subunit [bacterium]|jgi:mannose-6-phosphate isomerase|nr:type I phosphomannose isomerase catalytic subunit [bacterium]